MRPFDAYPKTLKKLIRYILQESTIEQVESFERLLSNAIKLRKEQLNREKTG